MLRSQLAHVSLVFVFSYVFQTSGRILRLQPGNHYEVCDGESAILTCPTASHVLVVRASQYGRMQAGSQCLQRGIRYGYDHGSIGCRINVTNQLKTRCARQTNCTIRVPNDFSGIEPCDYVVTKYLELSYDCILDMTGRPTTYTIAMNTEYNRRGGIMKTVATGYIILFGETGNNLQLPLTNQFRTDTRQRAYYVSQHYSEQYVFTNVASVGVLKCADFQVLNGSKPWYLSSFTIRSTESASFAVNSFYFTDSEYWPATRGCGTSYRIRMIADSAPPTDNSGLAYATYITLIGEAGNSSQLVLGVGDDIVYYDGHSFFDKTYSFSNLPPIGRVSCIHIRRDNRHDVDWFLRSIEVESEAGNSLINVSSWIPSESQFPKGIVACGNGSSLCSMDLEASCPMPQFMVETKALTTLQLVQKLVEMNMLHHCPSLQNFFICTSSFLKISSQCSEDQQIDKAERQRLQMLSSLVDYACRSNLDVINCHKKCLLQVADDGNLTVPLAVMEQCRVHPYADNTSRHWSPLCQSHEFLSCLTEVVAEHCNQTIAYVVSKFYVIVSNQFCDETTKPACPYDFTLSDSGCHKLIISRYGWNGAATECSRVNRGGHLAFITNEAEQHQIEKVIDKTSGSDCSGKTTAYWIGGRRQPGTPAFRWYYNATNVVDTMCYENWSSLSSLSTEGDPTQCAFVQRTDSGYKWLSQDCSRDLDSSSQTSCSVCEIDLQKERPTE